LASLRRRRFEMEEWDEETEELDNEEETEEEI
jgi:hypothetical protein